jgi:hypothetical protein
MTSLMEKRFRHTQPGVVMYLDGYSAAKGIVSGTHRPSTQDEIGRFHRERTEEQEKFRKAVLNNQPKSEVQVVFVNPDQMDNAQTTSGKRKITQSSAA